MEQPAKDILEYRTIILGAMLHDIGKLLHRGRFPWVGAAGKHPQVSKEFVAHFRELFEPLTDFDLLLEIVQRHHEDPRMGEELLVQNAPARARPFALMVSEADNYSSAERGERSERLQDYKTKPLACVFARFQVSECKPTPRALNYRPHAIAPDTSFPEDFATYDTGDLEAHLRGFGAEFGKLAQRLKGRNFDTVFSHLFGILQKYAWCIPSNTQEETPDVSLFDHLKTSAAIAACLYQFHAGSMAEAPIRDRDTDKFILLAGDISGIQDYLYDIAHTGAGGVARRLRARSMLVSLMSKVASHQVLHRFNLPLCNIIMASGGKFYILLPHLREGEARLQELRFGFDRWCHEHFNGELRINLGWQTFSAKAFGRFGQILEAVGGSLQLAKYQPLHRYLCQDGAWHEERFVLSANVPDEEGVCQSCRKRKAVAEGASEEALCTSCRRDAMLGQQLPRARFVALYDSEDVGRFALLGHSFNLAFRENAADVKGNPYMLLYLNSFDPVSVNLPVATFMVANHVPRAGEDTCADCSAREACADADTLETGNTLTFECIGQKSTGRPLLAYLKADVDRLGLLFAYGLPEKAQTISRTTTASWLLDLFFSSWVNDTLAVKYPDIYTAYSGGDDLLVIGPWNRVFAFAKRLSAEFTRFVNRNPNITLSAGISLARRHTPVPHAARTSNQALSNSKDAGRDRLTAFTHTMAWSKFPELLAEAERLTDWLRARDLSTAFVRHLLYYGRLHHLYKDEGKVVGLRYLPLLSYDIARNLPPADEPDDVKRAVRQWADALRDLANPLLPHLTFLAKYALLASAGAPYERQEISAPKATSEGAHHA